MTALGLPREQGKQAYYDGKRTRDNPYSRNSNDWHCWREGYVWASFHRHEGRSESEAVVSDEASDSLKTAAMRGILLRGLFR